MYFLKYSNKQNTNYIFCLIIKKYILLKREREREKDGKIFACHCNYLNLQLRSFHYFNLKYIILFISTKLYIFKIML